TDPRGQAPGGRGARVSTAAAARAGDALAGWAGLLPVDKPGGVTSHDVVALARRRLGPVIGAGRRPGTVEAVTPGRRPGTVDVVTPGRRPGTVDVRVKIPRTVAIGHLGTLDPAATGLLVLAIGAATRCATVWQGGAKT